ncbi:MAG: tyrosine-type recombinase/integrase, partial [Bryobacteraceae bacterium]
MTSPLPLSDRKIDLLDIARIKERILSSRLAANTIRNYESAWKSFPPWCEETGRASVPATAGTCVEFAAWSIAQGYRLETVFMRLKAIRYKHREMNLPNPVGAEVQEFMRCAKRDLQERSGAKEALTPVQLLRISDKLFHRGRVRDLRDRAMLVVTFACGWRRSEMASLDLSDVPWTDEGMLIRLGKSKTDQVGRGRVVHIPRGKQALTCPVRLLKDWLHARGLWRGPLFTRVHWNELVRARLNPDAVNLAVKRGLRLIGENPEAFGAH